MGHQIGNRLRPRRGSLQVWPRKRAKRVYPNVKTWPEVSETRLLAFAGYKAGMTQVFVTDNRKNSMTKGLEIVVPVTIIEVPPLKLLGVRLYGRSIDGLSVLTELWSESLDKELNRKLQLPKKKAELKKAEDVLAKSVEVRLIVYTQPKLTRIGKKKPEIFEIKIGGAVNEAFSYAKDLLTKQVSISDVFKEGDYVDTFSVSKGKGVQGSVKRFGVRILQHKAEKMRRKVGALGSQTPSKTPFRACQYGQMGFNSRCEYNKQILKIGSVFKIDGGLVHYGFVNNEYILVAGSIPGAKRRLIIMRKAVRPSKYTKGPAPEITNVMMRSQQ